MFLQGPGIVYLLVSGEIGDTWANHKEQPSFIFDIEIPYNRGFLATLYSTPQPCALLLLSLYHFK